MRQRSVLNCHYRRGSWVSALRNISEGARIPCQIDALGLLAYGFRAVEPETYEMIKAYSSVLGASVMALVLAGSPVFAANSGGGGSNGSHAGSGGASANAGGTA